MSAEENKSRVNRLVDAIWDKGSPTAVEELFSPDVIDHNPSPGQASGVEGQKQAVTDFRTAFPDLRTTNDDLVAEGDKVVLRWSGRGTHQGPLFGIPPTGKQATFTGIEIYRLENGQVVERWAEFDVFGILVQLGIVPMPG
ncbi:MAG: ester cyclase [Anaerolineae bacterium]